MAKNIDQILTELKIQMALGALPEYYKIDVCRGIPTVISKGRRTCHLCGEKCIRNGDNYYSVNLVSSSSSWPKYVNICLDCSWLSLIKMIKLKTCENLK